MFSQGTAQFLERRLFSRSFVHFRGALFICVGSRQFPSSTIHFPRTPPILVERRSVSQSFAKFCKALSTFVERRSFSRNANRFRGTPFISLVSEVCHLFSWSDIHFRGASLIFVERRSFPFSWNAVRFRRALFILARMYNMVFMV